MGEYLQIFRARVPQQSVAALLEIRPAAIVEPDVLTWSRPDGEQRLMARAAEFDAITRMHDLLVEVEEPLRGEIIHTSSR